MHTFYSFCAHILALNWQYKDIKSFLSLMGDGFLLKMFDYENKEKENFGD